MPAGDLVGPCGRPGAREHHVGDPCTAHYSSGITVFVAVAPHRGMLIFCGFVCGQLALTVEKQLNLSYDQHALVCGQTTPTDYNQLIGFRTNRFNLFKG